MQFPLTGILRAGASALLISASACSASDGADLLEVEQSLRTFQVGPGKAYSSLQQVAPLLNAGDVVEVYGGTTYPGDIRLTLIEIRTGPAMPIFNSTCRLPPR